MDGKDGRRGRRRRRKVARRWVSKGGAKWSWYGERRCCVRPTQTGPRFKALRAAYLSLPSFFFLPATAVYHLRGPVIPSRLRVSDLHTYAPTRPTEGSTDPAICAYNRPQTHLLRSYSFLENYWPCHVWGVRPRNSDRSIGRIRNP